MKKILFAVAIATMFVSCDNIHEQKERVKTLNIMAQRYSCIVELEFNGERHEYVCFSRSKQGSLSHWESCKFCKNK